MSHMAADTPQEAPHQTPHSQARLKQQFMMPFFGVTGAILLLSLINIIIQGAPLAWIGTLVSATGLLGLMVYLTRSGKGRTSASAPGAVAASGSGVVLTLLPYVTAYQTSALAVICALVVFAGTLGYIFWYSRLGRTPSPQLSVGNDLPEFTLEDASGKSVRSSEFRGRPNVWLFFRGNWCPLCVAQVQELVDQYKRLEAAGAEVILVSPQSHEKTRELAERFDVKFHFLLDPGSKAARQIQIAHLAGLPPMLLKQGYDEDTIFPTVVLTNADGKIIFSDQTDNYRVRPEPETFLSVLDHVHDS